MEQFVVSARKYRPQTFKDVVGQQAITNTLLNAIETNHLASALLFTGPRGVGKTTCARILARKINQPGYDDPTEDFAFNVFELDAASNNSVDDIRSLIDQVRIPPQTGKFKVYIIDEVHMLSSAAFNAFLKTLEEPPAHAIFILATTEKHKIIPTILSRCQIFDFKRITVKDAKEHLMEVAENQGITFEDDALHIIAQKADGAMRDALSIFDRVVSFCGKNLTRQAVTENLNVLDYESYINVTDLIVENKIPEILLAYNDILTQGFDGHHFIVGLASHFRDLLVSKTPSTISLLEVSEQAQKLYAVQSQKCSQNLLLQGIELANDCDLKYKLSQNQRLLVELCLMQIASITFDGEKKKINGFIIPPDFFKHTHDLKIVSPIVQNIPEKLIPEVVAVEKIIAENIVCETLPIENPSNKTESDGQIIEDAKPLLNIERQKISAFSLSGIKAKKELQGQSQPAHFQQENLPTDEFLESQVILYWTEYAERLGNRGQKIMESLLMINIPTLNNTTITFELPNQGSKIDFDAETPPLLIFLKQKLNNFSININAIVNEQVEKKFAFTPEDKYDRLKAINPNLELLRKMFELDFI